MKKYFLLIFTLTLSNTSISQQIQFDECYEAPTFEARKSCFEQRIFEGLTVYLDNRINENPLNQIESFIANFQTFLKNNERIHLITFSTDKPEIREIIGTFFSMQKAVEGIKNNDGIFKEVTWNTQLKFIKKNNEFFAESNFEKIVQYDEPIIYPGCEKKNEKFLLTCFSKNAQKHFKKHFNINIFKSLGINEANRLRITLFFGVNESGNIVNIRARAQHPRLEKEAERVLKLLPKLTPAKKGGTPVYANYGLPIVF